MADVLGHGEQARKEAKRRKQGLCHKCGKVQTHQRQAILTVLVPVTDEGKVYKGICLKCTPLDVAKAQLNEYNDVDHGYLRTNHPSTDSEPPQQARTRWQRHQQALFVCAGIVTCLVVGAVVAIGFVVRGRGDDGPPPAPFTVGSGSGRREDPTAPTPTARQPSLPSTAPSPSGPSSILASRAPAIDTAPPPPAIEGVSNIEYLGSFFEADCGNKCWPYVQVSGDTAAVAPLYLNPQKGLPLNGTDWDGDICTSCEIRILRKTAQETFAPAQRIGVNYQPAQISIFENVMAVGANWESTEMGAVYVYERNATGLWNQAQKITAPKRVKDANFGFQVDISGDVMAIGAHQDRDGKIGSLYIYRHEDARGWTLEQSLAPVDDKIRYFGRAVAVKGNRIAVGDRAYENYPKSTGLKKKGAVWLYEYNPSTKNWTEINQITNVMTREQCANWFGASLAFTDDHGLFVGCPRDDNNTGSVYYYEPTDSGYEFRQRIVPPQRRQGMRFGDEDQISVHGNALLVGTDKEKNGTAHVFLRTNGVWVEYYRIEPPTEDKVRFGVRVAMSGSSILVSSVQNAFFYEAVEGPSTMPCISPTAHGAIFEKNCFNCDPLVAIEGDAAVITKNMESLQIFSGEDLESPALYNGVTHNFKGVAVSGDVIVAGSPNVNEKDGSVTVYQKKGDEWFENATLTPDASGTREHFGVAVDVDGDLIVVGAHYYQDRRGSAYVFRRSGQWSPWVQEVKLLPGDPNLPSGFGRAVSIFNNTIAIGDSSYAYSTGAVFVYEYGRQLNHTITNDDCDGQFGSALALTRDNGLLIGCPGEQSSTGAVYFYTREKDCEQFTLQQKLKPQGGVPSDSFGGPAQIAVDGDLMVVGSEETNGAVFIFAKMNGAWLEVSAIETPPESDIFGDKVALSVRRALVSSANNVYAYTLEDC